MRSGRLVPVRTVIDPTWFSNSFKAVLFATMRRHHWFEPTGERGGRSEPVAFGGSGLVCAGFQHIEPTSKDTEREPALLW